MLEDFNPLPTARDGLVRFVQQAYSRYGFTYSNGYPHGVFKTHLDASAASVLHEMVHARSFGCFPSSRRGMNPSNIIAMYFEELHPDDSDRHELRDLAAMMLVAKAVGLQLPTAYITRRVNMRSDALRGSFRQRRTRVHVVKLKIIREYLHRPETWDLAFLVYADVKGLME